MVSEKHYCEMNMQYVTLDRMGKKKQTDSEQLGADIEHPVTAVVRVDGDLAYMLGIISQATKEKVSDMVSPLIRVYVERRFSEVSKRLAQQATRKES